MACGAAVVGSAGGPVEEVISDGQNGLLVPFNDPAAVAAVVLELLRRPGLREQLGRAARRSVEDRYPLCRAVQAYADLLAELLPSPLG